MFKSELSEREQKVASDLTNKSILIRQRTDEKTTTKYLTKQELKKRISLVLDFEPKVKIRKLDNGAVQVNRYL